MNTFETAAGILRTIRIVLQDSFRLVSSHQRKIGDKSEILVVRVDAIGDFVLWIEAARKLRDFFPPEKYRLTLLGNSVWSPLAEDLGCFDEVWPLDRTAFLDNRCYRNEILRRVRRACFEKVISPSFSRESCFGDAIVRLSSAPERIGSEGDLSNMHVLGKLVFDRWYTRLVPAEQKPLMELQRNAEFMRGLGVVDFRADLPEVSWQAPLPKEFISGDYYILVPGASSVFKQWPLLSFRELASRIYEKYHLTGVICGGPDEITLGRYLANDVSGLHNWVGRTTIKELVGVISRATFLVGNDTGAVHIAVATSTPAICISGGWAEKRFVPYLLEEENGRPLPLVVSKQMECFGCNGDCVANTGSKEHAASCMTQISVDDVWGAVMGLIEGLS